jgi:hypothetical protein
MVNIGFHDHLPSVAVTPANETRTECRFPDIGDTAIEGERIPVCVLEIFFRDYRQVDMENGKVCMDNLLCAKTKVTSIPSFFQIPAR